MNESKRRLLLVTMCAGLFLVQLDVTVVAVALPRIGEDLGADTTGLQWTVDAYAVALAALLLVGGAVGDRRGHRTTVLAGLAGFALGSIACGLAADVPALVAARALQGVGAAVLLPGTLAVITHAYPGPSERARAIGIWAAIGGLALPTGPVLGGLLVAAWGWRSVFWLNVPITAVAAVAVLVMTRGARRTRTARLDVVGSVLGVVALAGLVLGIIEAGHAGPSPMAWLPLVVSGLAGVAFVGWEHRHPEPMLPLRFFTGRRFAVANAAAVVMNLVGIGTIFVTTLFLQDVKHLSPPAAGAAMLPMFLPLIGLAPLTGRLTARLGPRIPALAGLLCGALGMLLLSGLTPATSYPRLVPSFLLLGAGLGLLTTPLVSTAVSAVPDDAAGIASGVNNAARQTGGAIGVALFGALAGTSADPGGFSAGLTTVGLVAAGLYVGTAIAVAVTLPGRAVKSRSAK